MQEGDGRAVNRSEVFRHLKVSGVYPKLVGVQSLQGSQGDS